MTKIIMPKQNINITGTVQHSGDNIRNTQLYHLIDKSYVNEHPFISYNTLTVSPEKS